MTEILLKVALNTITLTTIIVVIALFSTHFMFFTFNSFRTPPFVSSVSDYFISSTHFIIFLLFTSFCLYLMQCSHPSVALLSIRFIDFHSFYCSAFMYLFFIYLIVLLYSLNPGAVVAVIVW